MSTTRNHPVTWFLLVLPSFKTEKHATRWVIILWSIFGRFIWSKIFQQSINCRDTLWPHILHQCLLRHSKRDTQQWCKVQRDEVCWGGYWQSRMKTTQTTTVCRQSCSNKLLALRLDSVSVWRRRWWIYISHACVLKRRVATEHSDGRQHHITTANHDKLVLSGFKKHIGFSCRLKIWMFMLVIDLLFLLLWR